MPKGKRPRDAMTSVFKEVGDAVVGQVARWCSFSLMDLHTRIVISKLDIDVHDQIESALREVCDEVTEPS